MPGQTGHREPPIREEQVFCSYSWGLSETGEKGKSKREEEEQGEQMEEQEEQGEEGQQEEEEQEEGQVEEGQQEEGEEGRQRGLPYPGRERATDCDPSRGHGCAMTRRRKPTGGGLPKGWQGQDPHDRCLWRAELCTRGLRSFRRTPGPAPGQRRRLGTGF